MKKRILTGLAIAAIAFASCSDDQNVESNLSNNNEVQFTSGMNMSASQSKVLGDNWEANDEIGVVMVDHAITPLSLVSADNVLYSTVNDAVPTANFTSLTAITYGTTQYDFIAYYPYDATASLTSGVSIDVYDQTDITMNDFMYAYTDNGGLGFDKTTGTVDLPFVHQFSKVIFKVKADGTTVTDLSALKVNMPNLITTGHYDLEDITGNGFSIGTIGGGAYELKDAVSVTDATYDRIFETIVLPQPVGDEVVSFDLLGDGSEMLTYTIPTGTTFDKGKIYTFMITVSRSELNITGTIKPWETGEDFTDTIN